MPSCVAPSIFALCIDTACSACVSGRSSRDRRKPTHRLVQAGRTQVGFDSIWRRDKVHSITVKSEVGELMEAYQHFSSRIRRKWDSRSSPADVRLKGLDRWHRVPAA
jgi:hypothetical protein